MKSQPSELFDVTAGRRARAIARHPGAVQPSTDPTAGGRARAIARDPDAAQPIVDPTDPRCGPISTTRVTA